ncbi:MAG TPA: NAD(P)/FAD-dependent oxidoreductase [Capillimicrobium sp.]|nr:NAD(P)/FAD-dependent oxidoreductase [Capillimicrobium sp.]
MSPQRYDAVIVGGGHNGLTAAAYLARAGRRVVVLERLGRLGGAAVSEQAFPGVDARLSRYSYLVSLLPREIVRELGLPLELRRRRIASYTPVGDGGLLDPDLGAWEAMTARVAQRVAPTLLEPLRSRDELRALVDDDAAWEAIFERPIGEAIEAAFPGDDARRGIVLTDALIGTFASAHDADLRQNRCLLYHVIGNGTGDWDVPVGGMGAVTGALAAAARAAGAELRTGAEVTAISPDGEVRLAGGERLAGDWILANVAPAALAGLLGETPPAAPEGAQLKVNMLLRRLPRLRDADVDPRDAFAGTLHVNEGYAQLQRAYEEAASGRIPELPPCEIYCHSLTDPSILGPELRAAGAQTLTLFGLHMPARLFGDGRPDAKEQAVAATLRSLNAVLAEPIEDCLWRDPSGRPCLEARTPPELEAELGLPAGHIFHRDLAWPFAERDDEVGRWGVETRHERVLLCGAGARRGGGVSGIPGRNAAMAVLGAS